MVRDSRGRDRRAEFSAFCAIDASGGPHSAMRHARASVERLEKMLEESPDARHSDVIRLGIDTYQSRLELIPKIGSLPAADLAEYSRELDLLHKEAERYEAELSREEGESNDRDKVEA